jgi:hypothetical protein
VASRPDPAAGSRWAATRQNAPAGPVMAESASGGPYRQVSDPPGAVSSQYTLSGAAPARANAYGKVR